jgi:hypothetical protein
LDDRKYTICTSIVALHWHLCVGLIQPHGSSHCDFVFFFKGFMSY